MVNDRNKRDRAVRWNRPMISLTRIAEPGLIRRRWIIQKPFWIHFSFLSLFLFGLRKKISSDAQFGIIFFVVRVILFLRGSRVRNAWRWFRGNCKFGLKEKGREISAYEERLESRWNVHYENKTGTKITRARLSRTGIYFMRDIKYIRKPFLLCAHGWNQVTNQFQLLRIRSASMISK